MPVETINLLTEFQCVLKQKGSCYTSRKTDNGNRQSYECYIPVFFRLTNVAT